MPQQQILEGTWEEILLHAGELAGKRVSLTVLDSATGTDSQAIEPHRNSEQHFAVILEDLFQAAEHIEAEPGAPGIDRTGDPVAAPQSTVEVIAHVN